MLSVGERDASVVRTGPKSSAIITAPGEKCELAGFDDDRSTMGLRPRAKYKGSGTVPTM